MATAAVTTTNENQTLEVRGITDNNSVWRRLATFAVLNNKVDLKALGSSLSKFGLYYSIEDNKIKCVSCNYELEVSSNEINPAEAHTKQYPQCPFVLQQTEYFQKTTLVPERLLSTNFQMNLTEKNCCHEMNQVRSDNEENLKVEKLFFSSIPHISMDQLRANTFLNWPLITPNAQDMIAAGWAYTGMTDRVICIHCKTICHKWIPSDLPYEIHRLKSPQCYFIRSIEKNAAKKAAGQINITATPRTLVSSKTSKSIYALTHQRFESFKNWPHTEQNPLPPIEAFAAAGFYYTGENNIVRCFYCNGTLRNWQSFDEPKVEHCRWFPHCSYIRQYVGENLYEAIQRKTRALEANRRYEENSASQKSHIVPWTKEEIDRMTKARLDLPIAAKLREMGYTMAIIRKTFEIQLTTNHDDFKTDQDLLFGCFMLYLQIKIINSDENNILIPQNWIETYTNSQQQTTQQLESIPLPTKNIEASEVTLVTTEKSKVTKKPEADDLSCIVCLTVQRQIACLPCGHLVSCVACGHSLKTCPICRKKAKAFVRIYI